VFTSVTDLLTVSVSVADPLAYEPPTTEIFAVVAVSEMSSKTGFAAGKFEPLTTDSEEPLTEITALVGAGAGGAGGDGGAGGVFGVFGVEPDEDDDGVVAVPVLGPLAWNGSLLSKRENDCSWPAPADSGTAETSCDAAVAGVVAAGTTAPRLGAAGTTDGVAVGAGVTKAVVVAFVSAG
jgi:hypothetical protein